MYMLAAIYIDFWGLILNDLMIFHIIIGGMQVELLFKSLITPCPLNISRLTF